MGCIDHGYHKCLNKLGYYRAWHRPSKKLQLLHRVVYAEHHGLSIEDIKGVVIRHTCDNARCINPAHLISGTQQDNIQDMIDRGRRASFAGERNNKAKLSWEVVRAIRETYVANKKGERLRLASLYGVLPATISDIVSGRVWKENG